MRCSLVIKIDLDVTGANGKSLKNKKINGATAPSGLGPPHCRCFTIALRQITRYDSSGRVISPAQRPPPDNKQHSRDTSMPPAGFEPTNPASEWSQIHALDPAVTGIGMNNTGLNNFFFFALFSTGTGVPEV